MLGLYIITVAAGCLLPFLVEDSSDRKELMTIYALVFVSMVTLALMVLSDMAGLPTYGKPESIGIGVALMVLSLSIARLRRLLGIAHAHTHHEHGSYYFEHDRHHHHQHHHHDKAAS